MSWQAIARKDIRDAVRSRGVQVLFLLLGVLSVGYAVAHTYLGENTFPAFLGGLTRLLAVALPVLAILVGYKSVSHERAGGSLFLTLSFPHSRWDYLVGKVVGRSVVLLAPTLVALAAAGVAGAFRYGTQGVVLYPWFLVATGLYGLAFVGLAVGLSMSTTVDRRITLGAFGGYVAFVTFWDGVHSLTMLVLHRFDGGVLSNLPDWALLFRLLGPAESYRRLVRAGFDVDLASLYVGDGTPVYVDWWMGVFLLAVWFVAPLVLGYRRFDAADL
ncbi:ABC transporter permease subunit [Haloglomus litoreum]|uniref:ABC transporter permease subunit n=1 Tax=Haloglomus litoreum TaxID=3034026 RepID=UPI0023E8D2AF|nr:ABC transporter permease subunit [Haloglomus sp. DT116]